MKQLRSYTLPTSLIEAFHRPEISRSAQMSMAIMQAGEDPQKLVKALIRRMTQSAAENRPPVEVKAQKVSVTLDPVVITRLETLAHKSQLPVEHALRLAMESYLHKL